jgi:hypothetical protein
MSVRTSARNSTATTTPMLAARYTMLVASVPAVAPCTEAVRKRGRDVMWTALQVGRGNRRIANEVISMATSR